MRREFTSEFNLKDLSTFGIEIDKKSNPVVTQTRQTDFTHSSIKKTIITYCTYLLYSQYNTIQLVSPFRQYLVVKVPEGDYKSIIKAGEETFETTNRDE